METPSALDISVVIPLMNEEGSLKELYTQLKEVLESLQKSYEIIFIDDGSTDESFNIVNNLHLEDEHVVVIKFRRNFGKAAGLTKRTRNRVFLTSETSRFLSPQDVSNSAR